MKRRRLALTVLAGGFVLAAAGLGIVLPHVQEEHLRRELWADLVPPPHPDDEWRARRDAALGALVGDEERLRWAVGRLARTDPPAVHPRWNTNVRMWQMSTAGLGDGLFRPAWRRIRDGDDSSPAPGLEVDGRRRLALRAWTLDAVPAAALTDVARWLVQTRLDWGTFMLPQSGRYEGMPPEPGPPARRRAPGGRVEARLEIVALHPPGVKPLLEGEAPDTRWIAFTVTTADEIWGTRWVLILPDDACERAGPQRLEWARSMEQWPRRLRSQAGDGRLLDMFVRGMGAFADVAPPAGAPAASDLPSPHPDRDRPPDLPGSPPPPRAPAPRCVTPEDLDWRLQDHLVVEAEGTALRLRGDLPHPAVLRVTADGWTNNTSPWTRTLLDRWVSVPAGPLDMVVGHVDPSRPDWGRADRDGTTVSRWEVEAVRDVGIAAVDGDTLWCDDRAVIVVREEPDPFRDD